LAILALIVALLNWIAPFEPYRPSPFAHASPSIAESPEAGAEANLEQETSAQPTPVPPVEPRTFEATIPVQEAQPSAAPTPTSEPEIVLTPKPTFGELRFCLEDPKFTGLSCTGSQYLFTGGIAKIYVSWPYANVYRGMNFDREWWYEGELIFYFDGEWNENWRLNTLSEYTWLVASEVIALGKPQFFPPGVYEVRFFVGEYRELAQVGTFRIEW
jgi:hypothetical protein